MNREVRAAVDGAREAGVTDVLLNDSHWNMRNLLWDELPGNVRIISGLKPFSMAQGAEGRFDAAFFTGYHAKIGDAGVLAHTYSDATFYNITVNGIVCSEALLNAALLGEYGTPVVLVTGDNTVVEETKRYMPWITGVVVKDAIGYFATNSLTPHAACDAIREGAREAIGRIGSAKPFTFEPPINLTIETAKVENADFMELMPGFERIGGRTVRFVTGNYVTAFRAFIAAMRLGGAANLPA
jgi:D-amino peptidase